MVNILCCTTDLNNCRLQDYIMSKIESYSERMQCGDHYMEKRDILCNEYRKVESVLFDLFVKMIQSLATQLLITQFSNSTYQEY